MKITNIRQLLPLVERRPEFVVIDKGEYTVLDYVYQDRDTFDEPLLMECRGIKFDRDGLIIARPFRKFFNYGEQGSDLPIHRPHIITEKLDGSMIHPVMLDRKLFLHTRKGHTDVAKKAERHILSAEGDYSGLCRAAIKKNFTPIFEYVGPDNRIVLRYDEPRLVLLAMRHMIEGDLLSYTDLKHWGTNFGVPVVQLPVGIGATLTDVAAFVQHTRELEDAEGYVVYFDDGYMVKVKAEDYVMKHRALDDMSSKRKVVALCCQGFADDVLPVLSEEDKAELIDLNHDLMNEVNVLSLTAEALAEQWKDDRKTFALEVKPNLKPSWLSGVVFAAMDGKSARQQTLQAVEKGGYEDLGVKWRGE